MAFIDTIAGKMRIAGMALTVLAGSVTGAVSQEIDPEADDILRAMSSYFSGLVAYRLSAQASTEVLMPDGRKIQLSGDTIAVVERAKGARFARRGPRGVTHVVYDGEALWVANEPLGVHTSLPAIGGLDIALNEARTVLGDEAIGGSDLLYADPYAGLMLDVEQGDYLGKAWVGGQLTHHLSYRAADIDWQLWISAGDTPYPVRYVITSKWTTAAPQFTVQVTAFEALPDGANDDFTFVTPEGSQAVEPLEIVRLGRVLMEE